MQFTMQFRRAILSRRNALPLIGILFLIVHFKTRRRNAHPSIRSTSTSTPKEELLPIYELSSTYSEELKHLTPIDPSTLIPKGSCPIDVAHRNGYLHTGSIMYIMDESGSLLFMQRSADVVTCPSTWSVLGEHSIVGEKIIENVVRGVEEELGFVRLRIDKLDSPGAWTAKLQPKNNMEEIIQVTIHNATEFPPYYIRHYGPRNENRIDRQLTYLWIVTFPKKHTEIQWQFDDEVADHKWISLDETRSWLSEDATKNNEVFEIDGGPRDDGPDQGDFCHHTILSLLEVGLKMMP